MLGHFAIVGPVPDRRGKYETVLLRTEGRGRTKFFSGPNDSAQPETAGRPSAAVPFFPFGILGGHDSERQFGLNSRLTRLFQPLTSASLPRSHRPTANSFSYKLLCTSRHWRREALDFVNFLKHISFRSWNPKLEACLPSRRALSRRSIPNNLGSFPLPILVARTVKDLCWSKLAQRARIMGSALQPPPTPGTRFLRETSSGLRSPAFIKHSA